MQGPRQPSHYDGIELPDVLPPRPKRYDGGDTEQSNNDGNSESNDKPQPPHPTTKDYYTAADDDDAEHGGGAGNKPSILTRFKRRATTHAKFIGPGVIASVAYIDPGNWATDLEAGSAFGYGHLFIVLFAGLIALTFQILSTRLGCVSDFDLATQCRLALHDRPRHKMFWRWGVLYPLYALAESGIIFTDLAELLGSAFAINMLVPAIPLYAAVLITSVDVFLILLLFSEYPAKMVTTSMRMFELFIGMLVLVVLGSFVALIVKVSPDWGDVFFGYVPGPTIVRGGALYIAVGIVGATVMPHAFFIGSKMATMRRLSPEQYGEDDEGNDIGINPNLPPVRRPSTTGPHIHMPQPVSLGDFNLSNGQSSVPLRMTGQGLAETPHNNARVRMPPSLACVRAHLPHAVGDVAGSLLGFAILINSAILILAAAVFYYGDGQTARPDGVSDLFDAYELFKTYLGQAFAYLFAIGLLMAGQSASLTVTLSGQIVSEGFIAWRTVPWKRRLITRCISIVPSLAVAASVGRDGLVGLLIGSQVALSIVLTFVLPPLIIFTSQQHVMAIPTNPKAALVDPLTSSAATRLDANATGSAPLWKTRSGRKWLAILNPLRKRRAPDGHVSFANPPIMIWLTGALWLLITIANVFALYELGAGLS